MKFKKLFLGSIFIIMSGVIYEIDKALNYYEWATLVMSIKGVGGYSLAHPRTTYLNDNFFVLLFLIIGIIYYINVGMIFFKKNTDLNKLT